MEIRKCKERKEEWGEKTGKQNKRNQEIRRIGNNREREKRRQMWKSKGETEWGIMEGKNNTKEWRRITREK